MALTRGYRKVEKERTLMSSTELRVKELLKEMGWTTKVLAEKTGMSESYLTHIKNGTRRWNEDSLRRIAEAFNIAPVSLFASYSTQGLAETTVQSSLETNNATQPSTPKAPTKVCVKAVPMMSELPSYPSNYNNRMCQLTTGFKEMFVPVIETENEDLFCYVVDNQNMSPRFLKGDCLIFSPSSTVTSGDLVAVEYEYSDKTHKSVMLVSFTGNFIMLESVNHKHAPIALMKGKDTFRIIGKIICAYQKFP